MPPSAARSALLVTALCWSIVVFDGYDLIVYGTVLPELLHEPGWGLTSGSAGFLGSLAFVGMLVGALGAGLLADRIGRRRAILLSTAWFSAFTVLCAAAPNAAVFGGFRFLAGVGLGGLIPSASALAAEFVGPRLRATVATLMMSGVPIGGTAAALIGRSVIPGAGWRAMFLIALAGLVVVLPLCWFLLPESAAYLRSRGRTEQAAAVEARYGLAAAPAAAQAGPEAEQGGPAATGRAGFAALLSRPYTGATVLFAAASVATLFAWYGLGTWLPQLMRQSGFDLGSALGFLLALNLGAVTGSLVTAWAGDRFGPTRSAIAAALVAAVCLGALTLHPPNTLTYLLLVFAGIGTHGTQCLIIAAVANHYPSALRGTALGWALGVGRIGAVAAPQVGGWLLDGGLGVNANFLAFGIAALLAGALLWACPRPGRRAEIVPQTA